MATEYEKIKVREAIPDPCSVSDTNGHSVQFYSHEPPNKPNATPKRTIVRDGNVVTISSIESGRSIEVPWTAVVFARPAKVQPAVTASKKG